MFDLIYLWHTFGRRLGGRVRVIITGSAPLGADVLDFYRYGFLCPVHEAYGATESTGT